MIAVAVTAAAAVESLRRLGMPRLYGRILREARYRLIYPWAGRVLFPPRSAAFDRQPVFPPGMMPPEPMEETVLSEAEALCRRRFAYLNLPAVELRGHLAWRQAPGTDPLWLYCLHYGEWAITLCRAYLSSREPRFLESLVGLMDDWIRNNLPGCGPGWEPYPLSRRLVAWSSVAAGLREDSRGRAFCLERLAPSLYQQACCLEANREEDLGNNHLLANHRALASVGLILPWWPRAERWRKLGLEGLWREMRRQVLGDGVHDERSISYHALVLGDLLDILALCRACGEATPPDLEPILSRMLDFLEELSAPDGSYPLLNDTVEGYPPGISRMLSSGRGMLPRPGMKAGGGGDEAAETESPGAARGAGRTVVYAEAGYAVLRTAGDDFLCFDAGPMGPEHLPGHGHADALSFVLHAGRRPLLVDPGVYSYHDPAWRDYFRSTAAHNTATVDGHDQCLFWGAFRVAYPPQARLTGWSNRHLEGEHGGYLRLPNPVLHRRRISVLGANEWEVVDRFLGGGEHDIALFFQLAPGAVAERAGDGFKATWDGRTALTVINANPAPRTGIGIEDGWFAPTWYTKLKTPRCSIRWRGATPHVSRLILRLEARP